MHRTEADNNVEVGGKKLYTDGPPGTTIEADDKNAIQEEIATLIEAAGIELQTAGTDTRNQLTTVFQGGILDLDVKSISFGLAGSDLENYEEGTFTPVFADLSSAGNESPAYTTQVGVYTRIGNRVFISIHFADISTVGLTAGNQVWITGLPFIIKYLDGASITPRSQKLTFDNNYVMTTNASAGTGFRMRHVQDGANGTVVIVSKLTNADNVLSFNFSYEI